MADFIWMNHASFALDDGDVRLVCDPWLTGTAFNRGWRLLSPSVFLPDDFHDVTHIWFSHQHPDHFSPADLRAIAPEVRARITVLYHETIDKKVVRFCRGLGFRETVELRNDEWHELSPQMRILCNTWSDRDSWLAIRTPDETILNVNDCVIDSPAQAGSIARRVPDVDVLLTQFSYANWAGNPEDVAFRREHAREKLDRIAIQCAAFKPRYVIPFASFVWYSHVENFYHNAEMNRVDVVARFLANDLGRLPVVLYPGDRWHVGEGHDWRPAAQRYLRDFDEKLTRGPVDASAPVERERLQRAATEFLRRIKKRNLLLPLLPNMSTTIDLIDTGERLALSLEGLREAKPSEEPDIRMSAESLLFALRAPWGSNALGVNGRFTEPRRGSSKRFFNLFRAADLNDHGRGFDVAWLTKTIGTRLRRPLSKMRAPGRRPGDASISGTSSL